MLATGKLTPDALPRKPAADDCILGLECSARTEDGRRVMALVETHSLTTTVLIDSDSFWEVPGK